MNKQSCYLLVILFCFCMPANNLLAQTTAISFTVKCNPHDAVPFASVDVLGEQRAYICNLHGKFEGLINMQDSILVSSIGFYDTVVHVHDLHINPMVMLRKKAPLMNEVIVSAGRKQVLGSLLQKQDRSIVGGSASSPSFEIAKLMKAPAASLFKVRSISFRQKHFCDSMPLVIHIYNVNSDGLPGEDLLLNSPFMVKPAMYHNGVIKVDIRDANIVLEQQDFFVGIQFFYPFDARQIKTDVGIAETSSAVTEITYRRSNIFNKRWYAEYTNGFVIPKQHQFAEEIYLDGTLKKVNLLNLIAEVEIEIY